jgi:hypothetical protein
MDNQECQRDNLQVSMGVLGITMDIRTFRPLHKPTLLQLHQLVALIWIAEQENCLVTGG